VSKSAKPKVGLSVKESGLPGVESKDEVEDSLECRRRGGVRGGVGGGVMTSSENWRGKTF
jgi:hypothetical protein